MSGETIVSPGARISLPDKGGMSAEQRRVFESIVNGRRGELVGPLRAALHNPELAERWSKLGETLRYYTRIPPKLSELAVMVTARVWNSELEWSVHRRAAEAAGLESAVIDAIRDGRIPEFTCEEEQEIYVFTAEMLASGTVTDGSYAKVLERWGEAGTVELAALVGYYCMVALTLNVHRIPLPASIAPDLLGGVEPPAALTAIPQPVGA